MSPPADDREDLPNPEGPQPAPSSVRTTITSEYAPVPPSQDDKGKPAPDSTAPTYSPSGFPDGLDHNLVELVSGAFESDVLTTTLSFSPVASFLNWRPPGPRIDPDPTDTQPPPA